MSKQKRNLVDDLTARLRGFLEDLDRLFAPPPKPARVPVPVPARRYPNKQDPRR